MLPDMARALAPFTDETMAAMVEPKQSVVLELVQQVDDKHEKAHHRLREDVRELEVRYETLHTAQYELGKLVEKSLNAPLDLNRIVLSPKVYLSVIGAVVAFCLSISGTFWWVTYDVRSDLRDANTRAGYELKLGQEQQRLQQERYDRLLQMVDATSKDNKLNQLKIDELTNKVLDSLRRGK